MTTSKNSKKYMSVEALTVTLYEYMYGTLKDSLEVGIKKKILDSKKDRLHKRRRRIINKTDKNRLQQMRGTKVKEGTLNPSNWKNIVIFGNQVHFVNF